MTRAMTIVKANMRPDILLIFDEVERQLRQNAWGVDEYIPISYYLLRPDSSKASLLKPILRSLTVRALARACREWKFFFEGRRLRVGRLLDFLGFSKYLDRHPVTAVFILEQFQAAGACHAARVRGIPVVTHQHGDYYHDRVVLTAPLRDIEGQDTIRIVWNQESRDIIRDLSPRGWFWIGGSLKHACIQRNSGAAAFQPGLVFFETIAGTPEDERRVAEFSAGFLRQLSDEVGRPAYVAPHPMRISVPNTWSAEPLQAYFRQGIRQWPHSRNEVEWAICSDSTALFDLVASGVPCLHLKRRDSFLSLPDSYPGTIFAEGDLVAQAKEIIARADRTSLARAQLACLQEKKIGSPSSVDRSFSDLLTQLAAGKVSEALPCGPGDDMKGHPRRVAPGSSLE